MRSLQFILRETDLGMIPLVVQRMQGPGTRRALVLKPRKDGAKVWKREINEERKRYG